MKKYDKIFLTQIIFVLFVSGCVQQAPEITSSSTPTQPPAIKGQMNWITINSPSLKNSYFGDESEQRIAVYLPPSYASSTKRYPVVYFLSGFGDGPGFGMSESLLNRAMEGGKIKEMIVVMADGINYFGGSFYVNSPVSGNWEDYVVKDLVNYIDVHYRTISRPESRGIAGHSMGGYGALNLAMLHPDVFGAVYSLSPGLFDPDGLQKSQMFSTESIINQYLALEGELAPLPHTEAQNRFHEKFRDIYRKDWDLQFVIAYGAAFSPDLSKNAPYIDYPYSKKEGNLVRDEKIWKRWESGFGGIPEEIKLYRGNLLKLRAIGIDYGTLDEYGWIPRGCQYFSRQMTASDIPHRLTSFEGGHQDRLEERIEGYMLPFFSETLVFE